MGYGKFISSFKYKRGIIFLDGWRRIDSHPFEGDCDDFAWTCLVSLEGGSMRAIWALLTFRAAIWLVKSPRNRFIPRHTALWHKKKGWIDSTHVWFRPTSYVHKKVFPHLLPWIIIRVLWGATIGRVVK